MTDPWIYGYGSLMWRPGFDYEEAVIAELPGHHRALCVHSIVHRGVPRRPGLVLGLDIGGVCHGMAFRIKPESKRNVRAYLRARELNTNVYAERQKNIVLCDGSRRVVRATCFVVNRNHRQYAGRLPLAYQAHILRVSKGRSGWNIEYFLNTLQHLRELDIFDAELERLSILTWGSSKIGGCKKRN